MPVISSVESFRVSMPGGGESVLVRLRDQDANEGWGEAPRWPVGSAGSDLLGLAFDHPDDLSVPACVEAAVWDLWSRGRGMPLAHALGGRRTSVVAGARLAPESLMDMLITRVNRHIGAGYARVTLSIGPGWDIEPVRAVRQAFPALTLQVDAAGGYGESAEYEEALVALDSYGVSVIERPFTDLAACARLQARLSAAVAPEIRDVGEMDKAAAMEAGRAVRLDVNSGLSVARAVLERAVAAGWEAWCGDPGGYGVASATALALASHEGCGLPSDLTTLPRRRQLVKPAISVHGGVVAVPFAVTGLGHDVDEGRLQAIAAESWGISA